MTTTTTTQQRYDEHAENIRVLINNLIGDLSRHARNFDLTGQRNYGYVGDLAHVQDLLQQAHNFLNNEEN